MATRILPGCKPHKGAHLGFETPPSHFAHAFHSTAFASWFKPRTPSGPAMISVPDTDLGEPHESSGAPSYPHPAPSSAWDSSCPRTQTPPRSNPCEPKTCSTRARLGRPFARRGGNRRRAETPRSSLWCPPRTCCQDTRRTRSASLAT
eukprot:29446-Pelagococcus_subviridis.AAC.3